MHSDHQTAAERAVVSEDRPPLEAIWRCRRQGGGTRGHAAYHRCAGLLTLLHDPPTLLLEAHQLQNLTTLAHARAARLDNVRPLLLEHLCPNPRDCGRRLNGQRR
eukprot:scaffold19439_cov56-Phaeocystis_antarctica.AAC.2